MKKQSIYLRSISCKDIKSPIPFQKPSLYAAVSLSATSQRHRTPVDTDNGENPEWDCSVRFDLSGVAAPPSDGRDLLLHFDLTAQVPVLGDRLVGTADIPVSDLTDGGASGHVSYQVRGPDGKANGTIQLWYQIEGSELPGDMPYYSPEPSAPPAADFSYNPRIEPGPVYSATLPGTVPYNFQSVNSGPVCYPPPVIGSATNNSEPIYSGSVEPGRVYDTPAGTEFLPYPPPPSSQLYPPPNSGFGSAPPDYPPPKTHSAAMDQSASGSTHYPVYPPPGTHYPPMDHAPSGSTYYPPPVDHAVSGSTYYPPPMDHTRTETAYYQPPGTRYRPVGGSDCCDCEYKEAEPVVAYPASNGYYPPPPRNPYY